VRKELEDVLPKRATEGKVLIYKDSKGTGRVPAAARPVLSVLLSDLKKVREENRDLDENDVTQEYLARKLTDRYGPDRVEEMKPFVCRVVDRQGNRIPDFADWTLLDDDVGDDDLGDEEGPLEDDGDFEPEPPRGRHREEPPRAQSLDVQQYDALAAANRREGETAASNSLTPLLAMMQQQAQAQAAAQAQQMQMMMAMFQNSRETAQAAEAGKNSTMVGLVTALAPIIAQVLKPKEDNTEKLLAILLPVLAGKGDSTSETMKMIPQILGEVSKQQMSLMGASAQQTVQLQGEANKHVVQSLIATMKDIQKETHPPAESEGGGMFENLAKIAGPVIGAMMAPKPAGEPPALDAPRLPAPQPAPRPRPPAAKAPPPPAPAAQPERAQTKPATEPPPVPAQPAAPNPADVADAQTIRCFEAVLGWQAGRYVGIDKAKVLGFVRQNAPPPLLAAIRSGDFAQVVAAGQEPVMRTPHLLAWISQEENQTYLQEFLNEVRELDKKLTAEAEAAAKLAEKPAEPKPKPAIPVKPKKVPPPPAAPAASAAPTGPASSEAPQAPPAAATEAPSKGG
jgi:hypothetical protein